MNTHSDTPQTAGPRTIEDGGPANHYLGGLAQMVLAGLSSDRRKHVYGLTVPPAVVARRRARSKAARASRKANRS